MLTYQELDIENDAWGHAYEVHLPEVLFNMKDAQGLLDQLCLQLGLTPLDGKWDSIPFEKASRLLKNCLTYDIAYSSSEISDSTTVDHVHNRILSHLDVQDIEYAVCNCFGNPWEQIGNGYSFNSLTQHTFDIGIAIFDSQKLIFAYFMSED